jgi:AcrR family transcriptional regulator
MTSSHRRQYRRPYRLGKRAVTAAATRQRITDAARELIVAGEGFPSTNVHDIAKRAGVTRATVYQQFGSKHELLLAVLNDALDRADVRVVRKALQDHDPARATRRLLRASCRFWAGEYELFSRFKGLAALDAEVAGLDAL